MRTTKIGNYVYRAETWNPVREASGEYIQYIDLSSVNSVEKCIVGSHHILTDNAPSRARQLVRVGDIIVSTVRPNLNGVARVPIELDGATASTGFCILRCNETELLPEYLFHWVQNPRFVDDMARKATGASYPAVSDRIIFDSEIPLPPLDEQRRIAAILDQADDLRRKRRQAMERLNGLAQAIFVEIFGDILKNDQKWESVPLETVADIKLGKMLDEKKQARNSKYPYLRNANVQWHHFDLSSVFEMSFSEKERKSLLLKKGDILICEGGEPGRCAIWNEEIAECYYQKALHRCRVHPDVLNEAFLIHALRFMASRQALAQTITAATISHLTAEKLKKLIIPTPPLALQQVFASHLTKLEKMSSHQKTHLAKLDTLFASLQHRAFRGELAQTTPEELLALA